MTYRLLIVIGGVFLLGATCRGQETQTCSAAFFPLTACSEDGKR